jgi:NAD(P)-dependent dehydrogenase (short-subunit alcohol dehydrogenase family)
MVAPGLLIWAARYLHMNGDRRLIGSFNHGVVGMADNAPYTAAKHGVHGLTRSAALELAAFGVRVNAVAHGVTHQRGQRRAACRRPAPADRGA